jgi:hypothetical protein
VVVNSGWKRVPECLVDEAEVRVAAIAVPASESWRDAQIFGAAAAESTAAVGAAEPSDADPVTQHKPAHAVSDGLDDADHLVARSDIGILGGQVSLSEVQIGAAHAAAVDLDANLSRKRGGHPAFHPSQRLTIDRSRLTYGPGVHLDILTSRPWRWKPLVAASVIKREPSSGTCF